MERNYLRVNQLTSRSADTAPILDIFTQQGPRFFPLLNLLMNHTDKTRGSCLLKRPIISNLHLLGNYMDMYWPKLAHAFLICIRYQRHYRLLFGRFSFRSNDGVINLATALSLLRL